MKIPTDSLKFPTA